MNEAQIIHRMEHIDAYTHGNPQQMANPMGNQMMAQTIGQI